MTRSEIRASSAPAPSPNTAVEHSDGHGDGLLQRPFVQNVLPFLTSLSVHAGILIFGLLVFGAVKLVQMPQAFKDEIIIPETAYVTEGSVGGIPNPGLNHDMLRPSAQEHDPSSAAKGFNETNGPSVDPAPAGGADASASLMDPGLLTAIGGKGKTSR